MHQVLHRTCNSLPCLCPVHLSLVCVSRNTISQSSPCFLYGGHHLGARTNWRFLYIDLSESFGCLLQLWSVACAIFRLHHSVECQLRFDIMHLTFRLQNVPILQLQLHLPRLYHILLRSRRSDRILLLLWRRIWNM